MGTLVLLAGCSCGRTVAPIETRPPPAVRPAEPGGQPDATYEVHEWGLLRGTADDRAVLSGPRAELAPMVMAKPVLYFHRHGAGALVVDVEARMVGGHVVEHWPISSPGGGEQVAWRNVSIEPGSCRGSRYPTLAEEPCSRLADGCEAATLATVETTDGDCVYWPRPAEADGPRQAWNHLFYRGETTSAPALPLRLALLADGRVRVTATGIAPIPGRIVRLRRANGVAGVTDAADVAAPPPPGASVVLASPTGQLADARAALAASLRDAGLTEAEVEAFRRSWDEALFGAPAAASARLGTPSVVSETTIAGPVPPPTATTSLLYVLPASAADGLATLTFSPPPRAVRRAIVVWIDEAAAARL